MSWCEDDQADETTPRRPDSPPGEDVDTSTFSGRCLVARQLWVWHQGKWKHGTVRRFQVATNMHEVEFDGRKKHLLLCGQRVRMEPSQLQSTESPQLKEMKSVADALASTASFLQATKEGTPTDGLDAKELKARARALLQRHSEACGVENTRGGNSMDSMAGRVGPGAGKQRPPKKKLTPLNVSTWAKKTPEQMREVEVEVEVKVVPDTVPRAEGLFSDLHNKPKPQEETTGAKGAEKVKALLDKSKPKGEPKCPPASKKEKPKNESMPKPEDNLATVDVSDFRQEALVGRKVEVLWPGDGWYLGKITKFNPKTGKHRVKYEESFETVILANTSVRLNTAGLPPSTWEDLMGLSECLKAEAMNAEKGEESAETRSMLRRSIELARKASSISGVHAAPRPWTLPPSPPPEPECAAESQAAAAPPAEGGAPSARGSGGGGTEAIEEVDVEVQHEVEVDAEVEVQIVDPSKPVQTTDGSDGGSEGPNGTDGADGSSDFAVCGSAPANGHIGGGEASDAPMEEAIEVDNDTCDARAEAGAEAEADTEAEVEGKDGAEAEADDKDAAEAEAEDEDGAEAEAEAEDAKPMELEPGTPLIVPGMGDDSRRFRMHDLSLARPASLLGYGIKVYWPEDNEWYTGHIRAFDPKTYLHSVDYDDGEREDILLLAERFRIFTTRNESFPEASRQELLALMKAARGHKSDLAAKATTALRANFTSLHGRIVPKRAKKIYSQLLIPTKKAESAGLPGHQLLEAYEKHRASEQLHWREVDLSMTSPESLLDRSVAIYWGQDMKFYEGKVASLGEGGMVKLEYLDGSLEDMHLASERTCLKMKPREVISLAARPELRSIADALEEELRTKEAKLADLPEDADEEQHDDATDGKDLDMLRTRLRRLRGAQEDVRGARKGNQEKMRSVAELHSSDGDDLRPGIGRVAGGLCQGEIVWGKVKGYPMWPVVVLNPEDLMAASCTPPSKVDPSDLVPVGFFGSFEYAWLKPAALDSLQAGVRKGFHNQAAKNKLLRTAMDQALEYLQGGDLPEGLAIAPDDVSEDEGNGSEATEDDDQLRAKLEAQKAGGTPGKKNRKSDKEKRRVERWQEGDLIEFPMKVSGKLVVEQLGTVEYLNYKYHCKACIWPVGYRVVRTATTPMGGPRPVPHVLEILKGQGFGGGQGPIFQVTLPGKTPVQGSTLLEAWTKLFPKGRDPGSASFNTANMLGLTSPGVVKALQALPDSAHCRGYEWRGADRPEPSELTAREQQRQLAISTAQARLPEDVTPVQTDRLTQQASCHCCGTIEEYDDDLLLQCDNCRMVSHMSCYGVKEYHNGKLWLCDVCKLEGVTQPPPCILCPVLGGALKRTDCGRWCHLACARWMPELVVEPDQPIAIKRTNKINPARFKLQCYLCKQPHGACIQCNADKKCRSSFHMLCAANAGFYLAVSHGAKLDSSATARDWQPAVGSAATSEGQDHTGIENFHYCRTHTAKPPKAEKREFEIVGWRSPSAAGASRKRSRGEALEDLSSHEDTRAPDPTAYIPPVSSGGCARGTAYDPILRRGMREPDVMEALGSKRLYVGKTPHVVTGRTGPPIQPPPASSTCHLRADQQQTPLQSQSEPPSTPVGDTPKRGVALQSLEDRLQTLGKTLLRRVAAGKSAIHGWGAFAKVPHKRGDMVVEYIGELVHPNVANMREAKLYNKLVGAGTYIFKLSDSECVDATCAGNMAHLLNHSCDPNCNSRVITIDGRNHVVIMAKQDVAAGEELTYDYRFGSTEKLPCNCGSRRCRGFVNIDDQDAHITADTFPLTVRRSELMVSDSPKQQPEPPARDPMQTS